MNDTIYREDAINVIEKNSYYIGGRGAKLKITIAEIKALPSANRPQGEWIKFGLGRGTRILFCTNCERRIEVPLSQGDSNYDFCPNCGAKMKGVDDEIFCR